MSDSPVLPRPESSPCDIAEDGVFVAECPAIPGCVSQGVTESETLKNIEDAIRECLEVRAKKGQTP